MNDVLENQENYPNNITLWVDADSCPAMVRNYVVRMGLKFSLPVFFVANKEIPIQEKGNYKMIVCNEGKDEADNYIYNRVNKNDLVITRDIVFADRLVSKNICVINDRGTSFTKEIIKERLSSRDLDLQLAQCGLVKHFHEGYDKKKFGQFANCFDKELHKLRTRY